MGTISVERLDCGMPLLIESMSGVESAGLCWLLPAGSSTDPQDRQGLCALLGELVFRGAGDLGSRAQADALDRLGLSRGCDVTTHHLRLTASMLASRVLETLPAMVDIVRRPRLEAEAIQPVKDLSIQAIESLDDDPHERAVLAVRELHNDIPLNRSHLGTITGIEHATREDLLAHWERRVRPQGSILALAGAIDDTLRARIVDRLNALLEGWHGAAEPVAVRPSPTKGTCRHMPDETAQVQIVLMHDAPPEPDASAPLERVVTSVLSGGMAARLFTNVREKRGLCYAVSASYGTDREFGRVLAYVGTTPERAQESLDVLAAELNRINGPRGASGDGGGIDQAEFERAITGIKSGIIFSGESTAARAGAIATDQFRLGYPRSLDELLGLYTSMSLDGVNDYLARRRLGTFSVVTLGPAELTRPSIG